MPDERAEFSPLDGIATFVVRIRAEGTGAGGREPGWVAHITNVLDRNERYVRDLEDLVRFIKEHLVRLGIDPGPNEISRDLGDPGTGSES
jgi:hypothetical protein